MGPLARNRRLSGGPGCVARWLRFFVSHGRSAAGQTTGASPADSAGVRAERPRPGQSVRRQERRAQGGPMGTEVAGDSIFLGSREVVGPLPGVRTEVPLSQLRSAVPLPRPAGCEDCCRRPSRPRGRTGAARRPGDDRLAACLGLRGTWRAGDRAEMGRVGLERLARGVSQG